MTGVCMGGFKHPPSPRCPKDFQKAPARRCTSGSAESATGLGEKGCCAHILPQSQCLSPRPSQSDSPLAMTTLMLVMGTIRA